MAHIIGLTHNGTPIMVNADHIIWWHTATGGTRVHLTGGQHLDVDEDIYIINERIDVIQAALETWIEDE